MGQNLRRLCLGQAVIHGPVEVERDLLDLTCGDESAHSDEAPVPRLERRAEPQVTEQQFPRVVHHALGNLAVALLHPLLTVRLGFLVERQQFRIGRGKLLLAHPARVEDLLRHLDGGHRVAPAGIEREMRDDFRQLRRGSARYRARAASAARSGSSGRWR